MRAQNKNSWVIVCDGEKALYFENAGSNTHPRLETRGMEEHENPPSRDINTDAPGRTFSSVGTRRSAMEEVNAHDLNEQRFLKSVAEKMDRLAADTSVGNLILVAPARALGVLRNALSDATAKKVLAELDKDLTNVPVPEIEQHLARNLQLT